VLFYHSQDGKAVVGVAKVAKAAFPDATDPSGRFVAVELAPERALKKPVELSAMKANEGLSGMAMVRQSRLSVSPVTDAEWAIVMSMAGE
jgi:predicted RNA-binding protein with PUA-like domain